MLAAERRAEDDNGRPGARRPRPAEERYEAAALKNAPRSAAATLPDQRTRVQPAIAVPCPYGSRSLPSGTRIIELRSLAIFISPDEANAPDGLDSAGSAALHPPTASVVSQHAGR